MTHPGDTIGPYTLLRTLGRGAFGEVWLAERRSSLVSAQVALKLPFVERDAIDAVRTEAALWLMSDASAYVTGITIDVAGGRGI